MQRITGWMSLGCAVAIALLLGAPPIGADSEETGELLSLMVTDCEDSPLDDVEVSVEIYRSGSGVIDSDSGFTDDGEIEFRFDGLQTGDEARVTLDRGTGYQSDSDHVYGFVGTGTDQDTPWTIETNPRTCPDDWWDTETIQSVYDTGN